MPHGQQQCRAGNLMKKRTPNSIEYISDADSVSQNKKSMLTIFIQLEQNLSEFYPPAENDFQRLASV